jgi:CRP/FNR family transcriptional regulator, cyclic AMP receptor protein
MATDPKLKLLSEVPLFQRLGKKELQRLGQLADEVDVPAGKVLMRQGEHGAEMLVISAGRVRVERDGSQVAELDRGSWIGEMALLSEAPRNATVTALEPTTLFVVGHREFHSLMNSMPSVRDAVLECVADRIRATSPEAAG